MREVFPGHHVACHLREIPAASFSAGGAAPH
jgi:hypothetical protein